jgi:hypothetical protein
VTFLNVLAKSSDWERDLQKFWQLRIYNTKDKYTVLREKVMELGNEEGKSK